MDKKLKSLQKAGYSPKEFVDNIVDEIKGNWDIMNTSYDKFVRTSDDYHVKQVQKYSKTI